MRAHRLSAEPRRWSAIASGDLPSEAKRNAIFLCGQLAVTFCAIGNAYGGLPSNLMFPMDRSFCISRCFSPLAHRGARVIGTNTLRISVVLQVSSDDQERE